MVSFLLYGTVTMPLTFQEPKMTESLRYYISKAEKDIMAKQKHVTGHNCYRSLDI